MPPFITPEQRALNKKLALAQIEAKKHQQLTAPIVQTIPMCVTLGNIPPGTSRQRQFFSLGEELDALDYIENMSGGHPSDFGNN